MIDLKQVPSILLLLWNFFIFILYGIDKYRSKRGHWRIPEKYLLLGAYIFGGFGAWFGGLIFHHKTRKWYFKTVWILGMIVIVVAIYFLVIP